MSGYFSNNVNFDDLFDSYVQGGQAPACGFTTPDGRDLSARYAPLSVGQKRADVGFSGLQGYDVSNLWAAKGTASYSLPINGQSYSAHNQARTNSSGTASATVTFILDASGIYRVLSSATGGGQGSNTEVASGSWLPVGAGAGEYDVQFETGGSGVASISNGAPSYANCAATRSVSASVSVAAASADYKADGVSITIRLRRSNGAVSTTRINASVVASGWF